MPGGIQWCDDHIAAKHGNFRFTLADTWSRKLFLSLLRRYDLKPYRYRGQRRTTVMVKVPKPFVHETLWPEFRQKRFATLIRAIASKSHRLFFLP